MPFKSQKQARMFYAAAAGKSKKISKDVAEKYIEDSGHQKIGELPEKKKKRDSFAKLKGMLK